MNDNTKETWMVRIIRLTKVRFVKSVLRIETGEDVWHIPGTEHCKQVGEGLGVLCAISPLDTSDL